MTELFKYVTMDLVKSVWHLWPSILICWVFYPFVMHTVCWLKMGVLQFHLKWLGLRSWNMNLNQIVLWLRPKKAKTWPNVVCLLSRSNLFPTAFSPPATFRWLNGSNVYHSEVPEIIKNGGLSTWILGGGKEPTWRRRVSKYCVGGHKKKKKFRVL